MTDQNFENPMLIVQYASAPAQQDLAWLIQRQTEVAQQEGAHWFRLRAPTERAEFAVLSGVCWRLVGGGSLCGFDDLVPTESLPDGLVWHDMIRATELQLPVARFSDREPIRVNSIATLELVRGGQFMPPAGIMVSSESLLAWADDAAEVRMNGLKFVARGDHAIVIGQPLPNLNGRFLTRHDQLLVPAGMTWEPSLHAETVSNFLTQGEGLEDKNSSDFLFLGTPAHWLNQRESDSGESDHSNCQWSTIGPRDWISVSRKAIRSWQC